MMPFFPLRKIKRNGIYLLFGAVLVVVGISAYLEYVATNAWDNVDGSQQKDQASCVKSGNGDQLSNKDIVWSTRYVPQPWRSEYKGQANLHVFEDWCGSSIASLRKNPHYPLYPHSRITVKKLAVAPKWTNYGLRIFGYIHPHTNGEFVFAVACIDNCEFWMSLDENPENLRLCAHVGKTGAEWSAPGEYNKYTNQISKPVPLQKNKRFYFELIHKHNSRGTDHVEVAWRLDTAETRFELVDSNALSLYTDESSIKMSDVSHIPQTAASHVVLPLKKAQAPEHGAEMLREDPRDSFFKVPLLDKARLQGVLPECSYRPSYTLKGRQIERYQGLQFVRMTYVYPNDCTRLTHMESENTCFYQMKPYYWEMYGFSRYMRLDQPEEKEAAFRNNGDSEAKWKDFRVMGRAGRDEETQDEDDFEYREDYVQHQGRKLFANSLSKKSRRRRTNKEIETLQQEIQAADNVSVSEKENQYKLHYKNKMGDENQYNHQPQNKIADESQYNQQRRNKMAKNNQYRLQNESKMAGENRNDLQNKIVEYNQYHHQRRNKTADETQYNHHKPNKVIENKQYKLQNKMVGENRYNPGRQNEMAEGKQYNLQNKTRRDDQYNHPRRNKIADESQYNQQRRNKMSESNHLRRNQTADENQYKVQNQNKMAEGNRYKQHRRNEIADQNQNNRQKPNKMVDDNQNKLQNRIADDNHYNHKRQKEIDDEHQHVGWKDLVLNQKRIQNPVVQVNHVIAEDKTSLRDQRSGAKAAVLNRMKNDMENISVSRDENLQPGARDLTGKDGGSVNKGVAKSRKELTNDEVEFWVAYRDSDMEAGDFGDTFDPEIRWDQTFRVSQTDFQTMRTDWIDLTCNVSGNLLISQSDVTVLVQAFMEKLHLKYPGQFSLQRVVNVEKKKDERRGSRYLLELELKDESGARVRLVHYVYVLQWRSVQHERMNYDVLLCNPHNFLWNPDATIHIIIPVKNQARWVQKFIEDMEELYQATQDKNVNIIIVDYSSTDMDIEQTLKNSRLPKSQYLRLTGNFERSAGLQAGIDLIANNHSIVFLCDLHLHFPLAFFDSVRKHCVEGHMAFAPIVMRLNCGATPQEPDGYWEVNGFGLLGIYKSDLDAVGGMNTKEFTNRWGGEDWELLDRIIEAGLEVERVHLRNFFHYHHSRRGMWNRKTLRSR